MVPLCSVITSTWHRHDLLFSRCIPGVQAQTYPAVEHVIVSDGPDLELYRKLRVLSRPKLLYEPAIVPDCLPEHDPAPHWGHHARLRGLELARGDLIAYCDDDDSLRPEHVELLAAALAADPQAGWAYSWMASHHADGYPSVIGQGPPALGNIGTPMIMHKKGMLEFGTWGPASDFEDWELVWRWMQAGIGYAVVEEITVDVWPSVYYGGGQHAR